MCVWGRESRSAANGWIFKVPRHPPDAHTHRCLGARCSRVKYVGKGTQLGLGKTRGGSGSVWMSGEWEKERKMDRGGDEKKDGMGRCPFRLLQVLLSGQLVPGGWMWSRHGGRDKQSVGVKNRSEESPFTRSCSWTLGGEQKSPSPNTVSFC